jgi:NADH:ubiquinone oxidoreductase subunit K
MFSIKYVVVTLTLIVFFFLFILYNKEIFLNFFDQKIVNSLIKDFGNLTGDSVALDNKTKEIPFFYYSDYDCLVIDEVPIKFFLFFSFSLFFLGVLGIVFNRKSIINLMLCVELMLFGASLNFIFFSIFLSLPSGQIFALIVITIAAADSAIGLGILIAAFYLKRNIAFEAFSSLKG